MGGFVVYFMLGYFGCLLNNVNLRIQLLFIHAFGNMVQMMYVILHACIAIYLCYNNLLVLTGSLSNGLFI